VNGFEKNWIRILGIKEIVDQYLPNDLWQTDCAYSYLKLFINDTWYVIAVSNYSNHNYIIKYSAQPLLGLNDAGEYFLLVNRDSLEQERLDYGELQLISLLESMSSD
jgi:hypothetical protein